MAPHIIPLWVWRLLVALLLFGLYLLIRELIRCRRPPPSRSRPGRQSPKPCHHVRSPIYRRPDPMIYSQDYLMQQGLAVTWDNPDIWLEEGGFPVSSGNLKPDTEYEVVARIWNGSVDAPAAGLPVRFSYLDFGVGMQKIPLGLTHVDLPVKGAPGHPVQARIHWRTPAAPGHYCLQAELIWADDANPNNNLGQENTNVKALNSPNASFRFPVRNDAPETRHFRLEADFYRVPPPEPCSDRLPAKSNLPDEREYREHLSAALSRNNRALFPVPDDWRVEISPATFELAAGEQQSVQVHITAPERFSGSQPVNVSAFAGNTLAGGVTLIVHD